MLRRYPRCQVLPVLIAAHDPSLAHVIVDCRTWATDVHEVKTRGRGGSPLNPANCMTACRACHHWITTHPREARALQLVLNSWDPEPSATVDD
jgi:5-methylcytosine-specific restriction endonuclease McrA